MIHWPKKYPPSGMYRKDDAEKARMQTLISELMEENHLLRDELDDIKSCAEDSRYA